MTATTICTRHTFCERQDHTADPDMHETGVVETPTRTRSTVDSSVSYRDGDREPELWLSATDARLSADDAEELINALALHVATMRQVQPTGIQAGAR